MQLCCNNRCICPSLQINLHTDAFVSGWFGMAEFGRLKGDLCSLKWNHKGAWNKPSNDVNKQILSRSAPCPGWTHTAGAAGREKQLWLASMLAKCFLYSKKRENAKRKKTERWCKLIAFESIHKGWWHYNRDHVPDQKWIGIFKISNTDMLAISDHYLTHWCGGICSAVILEWLFLCLQSYLNWLTWC